MLDKVLDSVGKDLPPEDALDLSGAASGSAFQASSFVDKSPYTAWVCLVMADYVWDDFDMSGRDLDLVEREVLSCEEK